MLAKRSAMTSTGAAERAANRDRIAAHIDAHTCYICEQHVQDGAALHGPTGAHWECHSGPIESHIPTARDPLPTPAPKLDLHPRMARANGGSLVHFVIPATGTALCGHKPKDTAYHMKRRGKWLVWKEGATVPAHMKRCSKCLLKAQELYPPVEAEAAQEAIPANNLAPPGAQNV